MMTVRRGKISKVIGVRRGFQEVELELHSGEIGRAVVYPELTGEANPGDEVFLNTTAIELGLGTGGFHFVLSVAGREEREVAGPGHIMKLRYTPWQIKCLSVEEQESPHHQAVKDLRTLGDMPVVVATLHSMLPLVVAGFRYRLNRPARVAFVMTDGAALPLAFSRTVAELKEKGLIDLTVTAGHAFGGDLEAITVPSALAATKAVGVVDMVIVAMGPGIVGSDTKYGFTGIEQAHILEDVERMGGRPIAVPRVSFADTRERHRGLSHHSRTVLGEHTYAQAYIPLPDAQPWSLQLQEEYEASGLFERHYIEKVISPKTEEVLSKYDLKVKSMGRDYAQDPAFFDTSIAAGVLASEMLLGERR